MGRQSGKSQNILQEEQAQGQEKEMGTLELVGSLVQSHFQTRKGDTGGDVTTGRVGRGSASAVGCL